MRSRLPYLLSLLLLCTLRLAGQPLVGAGSELFRDALVSSQDFPALYDKELDIHSRTKQRTSSIVFLAVLGLILLVALIAFLGTRQSVFGYYLLYHGWVWVYYFVRRGADLGIDRLYLPVGQRYGFEAVGSVLILLFYFLFLRRILLLTGTRRDREIGVQLDRIIPIASCAAIGTATVAFVSVGWGYACSVGSQLVLIGWGCRVLYLTYRRADRLSRIVVWAALALVTGILPVLLVHFLRWFNAEQPSFDVLRMSTFQWGVIAEYLILLYGLVVWVRGARPHRFPQRQHHRRFRGTPHRQRRRSLPYRRTRHPRRHSRTGRRVRPHQKPGNRPRGRRGRHRDPGPGCTLYLY